MSLIRPPDYAYVAYVSSGTLYVKRARITYPLASMSWVLVEEISGVTQCSLSFDGSFVRNDLTVEFLTDNNPWLFYVTSGGALFAGLLGESYEQLAGANVTTIDSVRGMANLDKTEDKGILIFYIALGVVYYNQRILGVWEGQTEVSIAPANAVSIKTERTFDWRIALQVMDNTGALYEVFSKMEASGWNSTEHISLSKVSVQMERIPIDYSNYRDGYEHIDIGALLLALRYATYSPTVRSAENIATSIEDPENPGQYIDDWGYRIVFGFDQSIPNAADYPALFKIEGAYGAVWYGQSAVVDGLFVTVTFNDFNNAGETPTVRVLSGGLSNGYVAVTESYKVFTSTNLVASYVPSPVILGIENMDARTIILTFDMDIEDIASQSGFSITGYEPLYSPEGELLETEYTVESVDYADPLSVGAYIDLESGTLTDLGVS
jgi:hypothetical protein